MKDEDLVSEFGKEVLIKARDYTVSNIEMLFNGKLKDKSGKLFQQINDLPLEKLNIIKFFLVDFVDGSIHNLLVKFNESLGKYKIITKNKDGEDIDLIQESDGLNYEYFGFIDEFSKYRSAYDEPDPNKGWKLEKD